MAPKAILGHPDKLFNGTFSYDYFIRINQTDGLIYQSRIRTDNLTYFTDVRVLDLHLYGFGNFCTISSQIVQDVLDFKNQVDRPLPEAIERIKTKPLLLQRYFPKYAAKIANSSVKVSPFDTVLTHRLNVTNCNTGSLIPLKSCRKYPESQPYIISEHGRIQALAYRYAGNFDELPFFIAGNLFWKGVEKDFRTNNYCSPHDTTPWIDFNHTFHVRVSECLTIVRLFDVLKLIFVVN